MDLGVSSGGIRAGVQDSTVSRASLVAGQTYAVCTICDKKTCASRTFKEPMLIPSLTPLPVKCMQGLFLDIW
eukprot:1159832-Pelagomonas_calceolata.AAC.13